MDIVKILMDRDGLTKEEATELVKETREAVEEVCASGNYSEAEEIIASELGLEMDYVFDVLGLI